MRKLLAASLALVLPILISTQASAAFIDIVVIGTWESANVSATINPFGLVNGDKFVMKSTYDDTTLFNGAEGVTATIDPTVNAGTSFDVIIPHAAGAPNPLVFDHTDHNDIGFAPQAQIEFDGTDATTDPGNFRNFESHFDFTFAGDDMDFDTFMGAIQPETDLFNISESGNLAAVGDGGPTDSTPHLEVVTNDMTADAGGPYVFNSSNLSLNLNGSSGGGNGFAQDFDWTSPTLSGPNPTLALLASGLTNTTDTDSIDLVVTENFTDFFSAPDTANLSYLNVAPQIITAGAAAQLPDFSITFSATSDDDDLLANALVAGFETNTIDFRYLGTVFLVGIGNVDIATLLATFGGPGTYSVEARTTDFVGLTDSSFFDITFLVPEPGTGTLLGLGLLGLAIRRRQRLA